jgi:hypothetical protein
LVGGPNTQQLAEAAPQGSTCSHAEVCYFDYYEDFVRNEIAINWNTAMIYALAAMLPKSEMRHEKPVGVINRQTSRPRTAISAGTRTARIVRTNGGSLDIPYGAKVYSLDGKLIAERKNGAPMPLIRRNGVFIVRVNEK